MSSVPSASFLAASVIWETGRLTDLDSAAAMTVHRAIMSTSRKINKTLAFSRVMLASVLNSSALFSAKSTMPWDVSRPDFMSAQKSVERVCFAWSMFPSATCWWISSLSTSSSSRIVYMSVIICWSPRKRGCAVARLFRALSLEARTESI